jgi:serine/threonine protein kinase
VQLAWKIKYCRKRKIQADQRREIDILKKLSYRHVVKVLGTYTQGSELGFLIWPVAPCDLATFMDDIDVLHESLTVRNNCDIDEHQLTQAMKRFDRVCPHANGEPDAYKSAISRLSACFGCLSGALGYVHGQRIRHKDIKPRNILISHDGLWLADFGVSSDFSALSNSQSEAIERGTMQYFAPEVAEFDRSGRAADMFSLGCIFLEMLALIKGVPLGELRDHRPEGRGSFQENLQHRHSWFKLLRPGDPRLQHVQCEVENMIEEDPRSRPSARTLDRRLRIIDQMDTAHSLPLHGLCCASEQLAVDFSHMEAEISSLKLALKERDHYINSLLASRGPQHTPSLPRPPMGPNIHAIVPIPHHTESCDI